VNGRLSALIRRPGPRIRAKQNARPREIGALLPVFAMALPLEGLGRRGAVDKRAKFREFLGLDVFSRHATVR
jgi:hypothetical protein